MICHRATPILLITPKDCVQGGAPGDASSREASKTPGVAPGVIPGETSGDTSLEIQWVALHAGSIGEALRYLRIHRPGVLVLDISKPRVDPFDHTDALRLIPEARRRLPGMPIVVLGASGDQDAERFARGLGASIYLPVNGRDSRTRARRFIESLHSREGPVLPHGPPKGDGQAAPTIPPNP